MPAAAILVCSSKSSEFGSVAIVHLSTVIPTPGRQPALLEEMEGALEGIAKLAADAGNRTVVAPMCQYSAVNGTEGDLGWRLPSERIDVHIRSDEDRTDVTMRRDEIKIK